VFFRTVFHNTEQLILCYETNCKDFCGDSIQSPENASRKKEFYPLTFWDSPSLKMDPMHMHASSSSISVGDLHVHFTK
jgi:hypothetical protein